MGCHCHHLELAIKHALQKCQEQLDDLHKFAQHTRNNDQTRRFLEECRPPDSQQSVRMRRYCETRWSSHYAVLCDWKARRSIYQNAISKLSDGADFPGAELLPTIMHHRRQQLYTGLISLLEPVAQALDLLQGDSYPTLPMVQLAGHALRLNCANTLQRLRNTPNWSESLKSVVTELQNQLNSRFGYDPLPLVDNYVPVDYIAAALDPRTKRLSFLDSSEHGYVWDEIKSIALRSQAEPSSEDAPPSPPEEPQNALERLLAQGDRSTDQISALEAEIQRYQSEQPIKAKEDALSWWKAHQGAYPTLAALAKVPLLLLAVLIIVWSS